MTKCFFILLFCTYCCLGQTNPDIKRTWHWYFGNGAGLDFSSGTAVADTNGKMHAKEGCAAISDTSGNLLFYTDGDTIWDKTHNPMPNGIGLGSYLCSIENSSIQGVLIVTNPADIFQYYVITSDCAENLGLDGYRYTLVDMRLNGGLGDVLTNKKRILLYSPSTEAITATKKSKNSWWIITHEIGNNTFRIYTIDSSGIYLSGTQSIGCSLNFYIGKLLISKNSDWLLSTFDCVNLNKTNAYHELFKFDKYKGLLSHHCFLSSLSGGAYNACYSGNDNKIYFTNSGYMVYTYNLCSEDTNDIQSSFTLKYKDSIFYDNNGLIGLELGPDNIIYISGDYKSDLSTIKNNEDDNALIEYLNFDVYKITRHQLPFCSYYFYSNYNECFFIRDNFTENFLSIPNIFTPNGDSINDYFSIQISGYKNIEYFIYNRWGELIQQGNKALTPELKTEEKLWNGKYKNNEDATTGVYYYLIKLINIKNETETQKGYFQLTK